MSRVTATERVRKGLHEIMTGTELAEDTPKQFASEFARLAQNARNLHLLDREGTKETRADCDEGFGQAGTVDTASLAR